MTPTRKKPGRPRVRQKGSGGVFVPISDSERNAVNEAARKAGQSAAQWMRTTLIKAAS